MNSWEERLSTAGCRVTVPRRAVVQALRGVDAPVSPQEILERAQSQGHRLGLVTVYRTLSLLMDLGLVRRVHMDDGCHAYFPASPGHTHVVVCQDCGRAVEFPGGDDLAALQERVEASTGYHVGDHLLQLEGLCPQCRHGQGA